MGEAPFPNRPFKPLVKRPHRGEILPQGDIVRAAPHSLRSVQARSLHIYGGTISFVHLYMVVSVCFTKLVLI